MAATKEEVFEFIDNMTILDMSKFIKEFEERYGVTAAAPVAMAAMPGAAAAAPLVWSGARPLPQFSRRHTDHLAAPR